MKPLTRAMCALACACLSLTLAQGGKTATESFAVTGHILGASGKSTIYVALWQADGFLDDPVQQVVIARPPQLLAAVEYQRKYNPRLGELAVTLGMFTPFEFTTVLAVTVFPTGIFASKFWSVLAVTVLTTQATIALMVWAGGGT